MTCTEQKGLVQGSAVVLQHVDELNFEGFSLNLAPINIQSLNVALIDFPLNFML